MPEFNEKAIGEGVFAADENNLRSSSRGSFVRNGGEVTVAASSTDVVVNIDAADIRLDATDYSLSSGSITLAANSTAYPRRDLVMARSGSFDFATGDPIDSDTNDTLVNEGVIDQNGLPIHAPEDIPEIQPPAFTGERTTATLLAMVYVPPGTTDSTGLSGDYITDLRMEGIGVGDVLRDGDVVPELEAYDTDANGPVETTVQNTARFAGDNREQFLNSVVTLSQAMPANENRNQYVAIPSGHDFVVLRAGAVQDGGGSPNDVHIQVFAADGTVLKDYNEATETDSVNLAGSNSPLRFQFINGSGTDAGGVITGYFTPS